MYQSLCSIYHRLMKHSENLIRRFSSVQGSSLKFSHNMHDLHTMSGTFTHTVDYLQWHLHRCIHTQIGWGAESIGKPRTGKVSCCCSCRTNIAKDNWSHTSTSTKTVKPDRLTQASQLCNEKLTSLSKFSLSLSWITNACSILQHPNKAKQNVQWNLGEVYNDTIQLRHTQFQN